MGPGKDQPPLTFPPQLSYEGIAYPVTEGPCFVPSIKWILLENNTKDGYSSSANHCPPSPSRNPQRPVQLSAMGCPLLYMSKWRLSNTQAVGCHRLSWFTALQRHLRLSLHLLLQTKGLSCFWGRGRFSKFSSTDIYISAEEGPEHEQQAPGLKVLNRFQLTLLLIRKLWFWLRKKSLFFFS